MMDWTQLHIPDISHRKRIPVRAIRAVVRFIAETYDPEKIILFGSYAYGNPGPASDVDLLVVMDTQLTERQQRLEISRALHSRPFGIDIIVRTPANLADRVANRDYFLREIVTKGKVMYARSDRRMGRKSGERLPSGVTRIPSN